MAEENKHPPTTEEQTPPEMPGKAPKMEQAEIPDVGGGPAPSAKVIDLSAVRSTPEKDGFGLVRIDAIVERLDGYISRNSEDGAFTTEILLPQE